MKNKNYPKLLTTILSVVLVSIVYLYVSAQEESSPTVVYNTLQGRVAVIQSEINKAMVPAHQYAGLQHDIVDALGKNWTSSTKNIAKSMRVLTK